MGLLKSFFRRGSKREVIKELLSNGAVIIDVRTANEFQKGHITGSKNIPLQDIVHNVSEIKEINRPIILCCSTGLRSEEATKLLKSNHIECENGGSWRSVDILL